MVLKPTADSYYSKMIERLELDDVEWNQIKSKMSYLRNKFIKVKKWLDGTGQGVDHALRQRFKLKLQNVMDSQNVFSGEDGTLIESENKNAEYEPRTST
ncbi:hypothetical protein Bhyg_15437 [Pseudolycoriella hygida]|uniref:Uncharacterized protein n=1 Tax=Pseudolycoriella hygida TaxID=35572 RepID=A0A9Q0MRU8_9DIPT|nr:hypothetical protein Bhyg_15437 [Pseudolycoriella hygida]